HQCSFVIPFFLTPTRMIRNLSAGRSGFLRLLCLFAATLCSCAKPKTTETAPVTAQILRLGQRNEPAVLDPATATLADEFAILRALCEGLLIPGENGEPQPGA